MPKNTPSRIIDNKQTRAVAFLGGSGSASGGVSDHGLLTGLADDDHAQYLRTDGTRTLTGNMAVAASVTIDGIDISAHAADANAHHAQAHAITGSDHTVTGSTYQIVGLTGTNTIGLLTPASSPGANAIVKTDSSSAVTLVDATITSDLFMTGTLDFGTNTIAEDATYLQFAGSKAVKFNQNIGNTNWTLYNAGGYTTTGSISITGAAGDLTVGSNVLFVDNSAANVGINMAPDSQFALDINGPARATYWIGPHAIQLKGVLLLAHFDGRAPYETNYSGESNGHMGQVATVTGGVIYRPGKFYKAAQFGAAVTNRVTNPSFETNTTGWVAQGGSSVQQITTSGYVGTCCMRLYGATNGFVNMGVTSNTSANTTYMLSAYVRGTGKFKLRLYDNVSSYRSSSEFTATSTWTRYSYSATFTTGSTDRQISILSTNGVEIFIDAVQLETGSVLTPYCDGTLGDGHAWTGTAHASTSTRTATQLAYATAGNIDTAKGTVMAWVNTDAITGNPQEVLRASGSTAGHIMLRLDATNKPQAYAGTASVTAGSAVTAGAWTHLAMTWDGTNVYLYVNGAYAASGASTGFSGVPASMYVGCFGATEYFNGLIDDLVILDRTMTIAADNSCAEIRSVYESNAPVFAETSTFSFRPTPKGLIWADDEGLWMKDTSANPVFGIYGGDATKSWGGFTMSPGDLLIGNNAVGSSAILWDQSAGTFGFYGAGSATAQVEVATDGKLTAGAGKVKLDSTGFHAYNAATNLAIDINSEGIYMRDGGPRTTITSWTSGSRIRWGALGEIYGADPETYLDDSSTSRTLYPTVIRAIRQGNDAALVEMAAVRSDTGAGAKIIIGEGFRLKGYFSGAGNSYATNRVVHALADDVILEATNLQLYGMTTSTSAVGTYAGKIKVRIGGTDRYIPYYAS